jgi:hypothetical protein
VLPRPSTPAATSGRNRRSGTCGLPIVFDVKYSANPRVGYLHVRVGNVWSPIMRGQTLLTSGSNDSLYRVGRPIPAHLRIGLHHDAGPGQR